MVRNNIEVDVKVKCIENETTQSQIAEDIGTTKSYVNRIIKKEDSIVNRTFVRMMEALGYDIELHYIKRETQMPHSSDKEINQRSLLRQKRGKQNEKTI